MAHSPYFTFYSGADDAAPESCLVYLKTGRKMLVDLLRFSPDEPTIVFRSKEGEIDVTMGLDHVKTIRHWHDLAAIGRSGYFAEVIADRGVATAVALHKSMFFAESNWYSAGSG